MYANTIILALCVSTMAVYLGTKNYDSVKGVVIIFFAAAAALLKIYVTQGAITRLFVPETFVISGMINAVFSFLGFLLILAFRVQNRAIKGKSLLLLFFLYFPFAVLQQLFFQHLFIDTLSYFVANKLLLTFIGLVFFGVAHLPRGTARLTVFSLMAGAVWIWTYVQYGNILWPILSHAIFAPFYYYFAHPRNTLEERLKIFKDN